MAHFDNNCKILSHLGCSQLHTDKTNEFIFYFRINPETKKKAKNESHKRRKPLSCTLPIFNHSVLIIISSEDSLSPSPERWMCFFVFVFNLPPLCIEKYFLRCLSVCLFLW